MEGRRGGLDIERALGVTMDLFRWLARETAATLGYAYPRASDDHVVALVAAVLAPDDTGVL